LDLVPATRERLIGSGLPYVIENVVGAPLIDPIMLCGSSFGLDVRRHRVFETNFPVMAMPCAHGQQEPRFDVYEHGKWRKSATVPVYGAGGRKAVEHWPAAMGIDWMNRKELAQAIPPAYTEFIGHQLTQHIERKVAA
jgi:DNA (cytosine-5)-methyltransferase 1